MMVGTSDTQYAKPFRWEIRSRESLGCIHDAGDGSTHEEATQCATKVLEKYLHLGAEAVVLRTEMHGGRTGWVQVETLRGNQFGKPTMMATHAVRVARAIAMRAQQLDEYATRWSVAASPEEMESAEQRFYGVLEALRAAMPQPE